MHYRVALAFLLAVVLVVPSVLPVSAATITVTTTTDEITTNGQCSLREAIRNANADAQVQPDCPAGSGADAITLPAGTITLGIVGADEDAALSGDLDLAAAVTITGLGAATSIVDGGGFSIRDRIFDVDPGRAGIAVTIERLTVRSGFPFGGGGGGVRNGGTLTLRDAIVTNSGSPYGGGILNRGTAMLLDVTVQNNRVFGGPNGGGIANTGTLVVRGATIAGNSARGGIIPSGGGLAQEGGTAELTNVTITNNGVSNTAGGLIVTAGVATLTNVTISENGAGRGVQNVAVSGGRLQMRNTIIASERSNSCHGTIVSLGNNLDTGVSCALTQPGDQSNTDPLLGPLASNSGQTETRALLPGSPAIDAGTNAGCPATDQRGVGRPIDGNGDGTARCDIGAYEAPVGAASPPPGITPSPSPSPGTMPSPSPTSEPSIQQRPEDDTDKPRKLTEEQRQQRQRTNRSGRDDEHTEGNVLELGQDAHGPFVVIANRDGRVVVRLLCKDQCPAIKVGDYIEVDGQKEHEQLFYADQVDISKR